MSSCAANRPLASRPRAAARQTGFSIVELLVALTVALFLLAGLGTLVAGTHRTSVNQTSLTTLEDEQRLALSLLNDVVQTTGYFDGSKYFNAAAAFKTAVAATGGPGGASPSLAAGQIIAGTHTSESTPDTLLVRYATTGTDGVINCNGGTSAAATIYNNFFFIQPAAGTTPATLSCSIDANGADAVALVNNVVNMQIWYGVATAAGSQNVDTYQTADQVTAAANWNNVTSLKVVLSMNNPLYGQPGQTSKYVYSTRIIGLQARNGP